MRNLRHCATHRGRVRPLDDLIQFAQAEAAHDLSLRLRKRNRAAVILDFDLSRVGFGFLLRRHNLKPKTQLYRSSTCLPRRRATSNGSFIFNRPSKVARTTLCGFVDPKTFVRTSRTPAARMTARTAPPAITPVPCEAGFINTRPAPNRPIS